MCQAIKALMHCQHLMTLKEPGPDSCSYCSIHSCARSTHVQNGNVDITLVKVNSQRYLSKLRTERIILSHDGDNLVPDLCFWRVHVGQHFVSGPVVLKAPVAPENEQIFETNHKASDL